MGPFFCPDLVLLRCRAQLWSSMAVGHRRSRRTACLTAASTTPGSVGRDEPSRGLGLSGRGGFLEQPIKECCRHHGIAEHRPPFTDRAIGGDEHGAALVTSADQLEEQVRGIWLERQVAELVNDQ